MSSDKVIIAVVLAIIAVVGWFSFNSGHHAAKMEAIRQIDEAVRAEQVKLTAEHNQTVSECVASGKRLVEENARLIRKADEVENEHIRVTGMLLERQCKDASAMLAWPKIGYGAKFTFRGPRPIECASGSTPWVQCWAEGEGACVPGAKP